MLLLIKKYKVVLIIPFLLMSIFITNDVVSSKEKKSMNFHHAFSTLIETGSKENKHLIEGWNEYIIKVLGHSNTEHLKVIEELTIDYAKAFKAFDEKYEIDLKHDTIQYTSKWLDQLVEQFGKNFVCNNKRVIMLNLMTAYDRSEGKKYDFEANKIISKELVLYLAYERYLEVFIDYYNQLNENDQKKMNAWKEVAEKYLSIAKRSHFAQIYYGSHMKYKIIDNAMQRENNELYMFFKKTDFPYGSGALKKAEKDLDEFVEMCKMQSLKQP
ncbi:MAG: hypothetical protein PVJ84_19560 [Desulfobacteraceae bacterium]|jgi:hypothetical protein